MDNLTHSLVGALIGQAGLKRRTGLAMPALIIGANLPDVDAACTVYGIESLAMRRGVTHGPIAWVLLPLVLAGVLWAFDRWQEGRGKRPEGRLPVQFGWLYLLSLIACLTHPALDWLNNYGIRLLEPFSHRWFYGDTLFIIDVWLWLGLGFATWLSLRSETRGGNWRRTAVAGLAIAFVYIFGNFVVSSIGRAFGETRPPYGGKVIASPTMLIPWRRELLISDHEGKWFRAEWSVFGEHYPPLEELPDQCDWTDAAGSLKSLRDSRIDAFLFWSRSPFVGRDQDGSWLLRDARFASRGADPFSVELPPDICRL